MTRTPLPQILCLCLSLLLGLMGVQTVGACPGAVAVAACGDAGVIWLDASGQPAKPCAHCPDCIATPVVTLEAPTAPAWHPTGAERLSFALLSLSRPAPQPLPGARAPPALV